MRIVIDGRMLGWTGIGRYTARLLQYAEQLDVENEYVVLMLTIDRGRWTPTAVNFKVIYTDILPYTFSEQWQLPKVLRELKPDLVHFTHFAVPMLYNAPYVVTVHDLILVQFKNYRGGALNRLRYEVKYIASRVVLSHAVRQARLVLTPTNYTKDALAAMFKLNSAKLSATILGVDQLSPTPEPATIASPYLFSLGNSYPYKNLDRLVDAYATTKFRQAGGKLVLGGQNDHFGKLLRERVTKLGLAGDVLFPGRVDDATLAGLYEHAELYVYPSLAEGFGLQGLESMLYGTPVLSSDASCLPEVCGTAAEYFVATDTDALTAKIDELIDDPKRRAELVKLGHQQIKRFSWKAMTEKTLAAYKVAVRDNKSS